MSETNNLRLCTKCKQRKDKTEFNKDCKGIDGLSYWCKSCRTVYRKTKRKQTEEYNKKYRESHKEYFIQYEEKNKERLKEKRKQYKLTHKEQIKQYQIIYSSRPEVRERNHIYNLKYSKEYNKKHYSLYRQEILEKQKERYYTDHQYRLNVVISSNIYRALKGAKSEQHWEDLVGYTIQELCQHLESQFDKNMTWDNYGTYWEIDHIIPKSLFEYKSYEDKQFKICWSLSNLRPLTVSENRSRPKDGSDIPESLKHKILGMYINTLN